jgi:hypothetical protein
MLRPPAKSDISGQKPHCKATVLVLSFETNKGFYCIIIIIINIIKSRDAAICIATGYGLDG